MSGPHFRDYHLLLGEQSDQIFAMTDPLTERARKLGRTTLRSIGHIGKLARIKDNYAEFVPPADMLDELVADNKAFTAASRTAHELANDHKDSATTSILAAVKGCSAPSTFSLIASARS